jgi:DNA-binding IclR family transcriptional regulator
LEGPLTRYTQHTVVSGSRLLSTLEEVRRTGVALSREQHHLGHSSMAAPLLDAEGHAVGAVEVMIRHQTETRRLHGILSGSAHQLTEQLSVECSHRMSRNDHSDRSPAKPVSPSDRERRPE